MFFNSYTPNKLSKARRMKDDPIVKNGLAITPADMNNMLRQGQPISAQLHAAFADDSPQSMNDWEIGIEDTRFVDAAEVYEHTMGAKKRVKNFLKNAERMPLEKGGE